MGGRSLKRMKAFVNGTLVFPDCMEKGTLLVDNGKIVAAGNVISPEDAEFIDLEGAYLGPGLVDIHCHGYVGRTDDGNGWISYHAAENPVEMARAHLRRGTTSITPSLSYSLKKEWFLNGIVRCKEAMKLDDSTIIGLHFEGPFTNPDCGGAGYAWDFSEEDFYEIYKAGAPNILHMTYSPEMEYAPELEALMRKHGICMDIGHTALTPDDAKRAKKMGARIVSHLFDAMGCHRGYESVGETGVLQESADAVLLGQEGFYYELICDSVGMHVKPSNQKLAFRAAGEERIILVTDCTTKRAYDPYRYPKQHKRSILDLNVTKKGLLNGSCLTLSEACRNFMRDTGQDLRVAFRCASANPAKALGLSDKIGSICPGRDANLLVVDDKFRVRKVFLRGEEIEAIDAP